MNANENSTTINVRMNRIQKASKFIRLFLLYGFPLIFIGFSIATFFIPKSWAAAQLNSPGADVMIKQMNSVTGHLWILLSFIFFLFWYRTILKLFSFFEKGILFTAETVRCIQILGGIYIAQFIMDSIFCFFIPAVLGDSILRGGISHLIAGLFIIFIGWLIDEARKIREEQELTV